ncbi:MAG: hypothetical protein AAF657_31925 [Acidobacteriota bacterium]
MKIGEMLVAEGKLARNDLVRALEHQGRMQGRLGTTLLEQGSIGESALLEALGRQRATRTVSHTQLTSIAAPVVQMVPARLAARYRIVPYELRGRTLFVASRDIGDALKEDEIGFLTSCMVRTCIGLEVRILEALQRHYHANIPARHEALLQRLASRGRGSTTAATTTNPSPPSIPAASPSSNPPPAPQPTLSQAPQAAPQQVAPQISPPPAPTPIARTPPASVSPVAAAPVAAAQAVQPAPAAEPKPVPIAEPEPPRFIELDAEDAALLGRSSSEAAEDWTPDADEPVLLEPTPLPWLARRPPPPDGSEAVVEDSEASPETVADEALISENGGGVVDAVEPAAAVEAVATPGRAAMDYGAASTAPEPASQVLAPSDSVASTTLHLPGELPPIDPEASPEDRLLAAAEQLKHAEIRDDIADVLLAYCEPYLRRRLVLVARKERILGWRGEGRGVVRQTVRGIEIQADQPSVFLGLRAADSFWLGALPQLPPNAALVDGLGGTFPKDCLVLPVTLRSRVVCYLYGDNLDASVSGVPLAELRRLAAKAGLAFEVYILKNKIRIQ